MKGAIREFYNLLTARRTVSNTYSRVGRAQSCANHMQHTERVSPATCTPRGRSDSSPIKFDRV